MKMIKKKLIIYSLFAALIYLLAFYYFGRANDTKALVEVEISAADGSHFRIYWAGAGQEFSEKRAAGIVTVPNLTHYSFLLTDIGKVDKLRIDTHNYIGRVALHSLKITQQGYQPILLNSPEHFSLLKPLHDIAQIDIEDSVLSLLSSGKDPNVELPVYHRFWGLESRRHILQPVAICLLVVLGCWLAQSFFKELRASSENPMARQISVRSKLGLGTGIVTLAVAITLALLATGGKRSDGKNYPTEDDLAKVWRATGFRTDGSNSYTGTYTLNSGGTHKYDLFIASRGRKAGSGTWHQAPESYHLSLQNDTGSLYHGYVARDDSSTVTLLTSDGRWQLILEKM